MLKDLWEFLKHFTIDTVQHSILVHAIAVDELICRPITRDCIVTELHKAMERFFCSYSNNEIILDGFLTPLSPLDCRSEVERE